MDTILDVCILYENYAILPNRNQTSISSVHIYITIDHKIIVDFNNEI